MIGKTATLTRDTFSTSRCLEYFAAVNLKRRRDMGRSGGPRSLSRNVDNGLDAAETASVSPVLSGLVNSKSITVTDNGLGLPPDTLRSALDYTVKVSDKAKYVSPSRRPAGTGAEDDLRSAVCAPRHRGTH